MTRVRAALAAPFRLALVDLLAAVAIAVIGISLAAGPAFSQEATPSLLPTAATTAPPATSLPPATTPAGSGSPAATMPATSSSPAASGLPAASSPGSSAPAGSQASPGPSSSAAAAVADPCAPRPTPEPGVTPNPDASPTPPPNLCPAQPDGANPLSLLAWAFTPIFQAIFIGLAVLYNITGDIGIAIILLTIIIRIFLIPVFRAQIVSQRRMQMVQPELRAIQQRYKGDRAKISAEQMKLYKERGVNPASGCLPAVLQMVLLLPMYQVFNQGLHAPDISSMLSFTIPILNIDVQPVNIQCQTPGDPYAPCMDTNIPWLGWIPTIDASGFHMPGYPGGLPAQLPEIFLVVIFGFGLSLLAVVSALLQLVQTRMMQTRSDDPSQRSQQRIFLILPAFSLIYGAILPAGLFVYWITTTIFSIAQQFLVNGYGGLFPLFGWTPRFAVDHQPRFPVTMPTLKTTPSGAGGDGSTEQSPTRSAKESAAGTIRPAKRRSRRRGRRR